MSFGVIEALRALRPEEKLELAHRLDRDTSGCLHRGPRAPPRCASLHELLREEVASRSAISTLAEGAVESRRKKRIDVAAAHRHPRRRRADGRARDASGKPSISEFRPVQFFGKRATLMEVDCRPAAPTRSASTPQHAGHPVAGDEKYGDEAFNEEMRDAGARANVPARPQRELRVAPAAEISASARRLPADLARTIVDKLARRGYGRGEAWRARRSAPASQIKAADR